MTKSKKIGTARAGKGNRRNSESRDLQQHLHRYGLRHFADENYYREWTSSRLKFADARRRDYPDRFSPSKNPSARSST